MKGHPSLLGCVVFAQLSTVWQLRNVAKHNKSELEESYVYPYVQTSQSTPDNFSSITNKVK